MDELDLDARNLLRVARAQERPASPATRWRVQRAVAMAAPATALLSGGISTAAAKGAIASGIAAKGVSSGVAGIGTFGMKAWFIFGVACGVGVTGVGQGIAAYRHSTLVHQAHANVTPTGTTLRPLGGPRGQHAVMSPSVQASAILELESLAPPESPTARDTIPLDDRTHLTSRLPPIAAIAIDVQAPTAATLQAPLKSRSLAAVTPAAEPSALTQARGVPTLAAEVDLLTEVQSELRNGRAAAALESLRRDDGRFAQSPLRSDLDGVRILALCEVGRFEEAHRATDIFLQMYPGSPLAQRVRNACSRGTAGAPRASDPPTRTLRHGAP